MIRRLLLSTTLLALSGCSAATGKDSESTTESEAGPWSFTDGSGEIVETETTPERIRAHAGEGAALMSFGSKPVGL